MLNDQDRIHELILDSPASFKEMNDLILDKLKAALGNENPEFNKKVVEHLKSQFKNSNQELLSERIDEAVVNVKKVMKENFLLGQFASYMTGQDSVQQLIEKTVDAINQIVDAKFKTALDQFSKGCELRP